MKNTFCTWVMGWAHLGTGLAAILSLGLWYPHLPLKFATFLAKRGAWAKKKGKR